MSNSNIDEILNEVAKGARLDGFHAKVLLAYPNQSDRYMKPAKQAIQQLLDEAYKKGYIDGGIAEITK